MLFKKKRKEIKRYIDGYKTLKYLRQWLERIDETHKSPVVEYETVEGFIDYIEHTMGIECE